MSKEKVTQVKEPTHVEIKYWSPSGIPLIRADELMILDAIRKIRGEKEGERVYTLDKTVVAFDLINSGDEDQDHAENFLNIAKVCSFYPNKGDTLRILCLREPFPVEAMSALHDVYVCSGSPYDVTLKNKSIDDKKNPPKDLVVGVNCVMMPVFQCDGKKLIRWTSIY